MNNQFGPDAWDDYLTLIEHSEPRIEALGVTDYCSIDQYEKVLEYQMAGRLPDVGLIFPNIELRLPTATARDHPVNIHLLVSPEDPSHVDETRRFLRTLRFLSGRESYVCDRTDLIRLGKAHDGSITDETAALTAGTNLFKVTLENLKQSLEESAWARHNIIVGVAAGTTDGTSGVRDARGSLEAVRVEIERLARVIFASSPAQRGFWIGEGVLGIEDLFNRYDGPKACIHGSDAHRLADVGKPDENRYTWIKGDAAFEALRQACLEPKERVIVGDQPLKGALDYRIIDSVTVSGADWVTTPELPLAPGLVAIIGSRGSGKTALADLIAAGAGAASIDMSDQTFLQRARKHLAGTSVAVAWGDGATSEAELPPDLVDDGDTPRARYLSQQFVERLCSSEGITDELIAEIERVIFEAHPYEERLGASTFRELLDLRASHGRDLRRFAQSEIDGLAAQIESEHASRDELPGLIKERARLAGVLAEDKRARGGLVVVGGEVRAQRLEALNAALVIKQAEIDSHRRREQAFDGLADAVKDIATRRLPAIRAELERDYSGAGLSATEWENFNLKFAGNPAELVSERLKTIRESITDLTGPAIPKPSQPANELPPFVDDAVDLSTIPLAMLRAEAWRIGELIGLDANRQKQLRALNDKIAKTESALASADRSIKDAEGASDRVKALMLKRKQAYASLFDGFAAEQEQLETMYGPLKDMLGAEAGTLGKLTFSVRRVVDIEAWAARGESLLDLRTGVFRGRGELLNQVHEKLLPAWENGASTDVAEAMAMFRDEHDQHFIEQSKVPSSDVQAFRRWAADVSTWLNGTEHISVAYGVEYDGVAIEQLSPGTRGIVLLLLYLAVDQTDDRPLIIDQPEENLDPKSIFDELVGRFVETRRRRQIIIVTHNANLVVNTDADQVIVATAGPHRPGRLPEMTYTSGGLENPVIRQQVCEILEGGQQAFEERARRLRIRLT
ncbi:AAA domain-containing protein, putative AbiEii toxin, Type IV TA system [Nocardioides sp. YR527]|nr:AAA family ATPase [Nocardioides sp. YR527]SDK54985.1 AAA domain-containing protein, putative AbiEii toxin, Type IV TA system [Nocardioides sp. YR527]